MKKTNLILNFLLIFIFTILALWFALHGRFQEVMAYLSLLEVPDLLRISFYGFAYIFIIAMIYKILCADYKKNYSYKDSLQLAFVGSFFSGITPSATGGQFGQLYVLKKNGISLSEAASILWKDFIIYQSVLVAYTSILMLLRFRYYYYEHSSFFLLVLIGFIVNSAVIVFLFTMAVFPKIYQVFIKKVLKFLGNIHIIKHPEQKMEVLDKQLDRFVKEIKKLKNQKKMILQCVILNCVRLTLFYAFPMYIAKCLHINVSMAQLLDIITMSAFVSTANAFFPLPGSSGGSEAAFLLIFQTMFTLEQTSSIMIIWRFATYHQIILVGGIVFIYLRHFFLKQEKRDLIHEKYKLKGE